MQENALKGIGHQPLGVKSCKKLYIETAYYGKEI